jgi:hypothetical protein
MSPATLRLLSGIFLIAHGWIHYSLTTVPVPAPGALRTPFWPAWWRPNIDPLWIASQLGLPASTVQWVGSLLWIVTLVGFVLSGLVLILFPSQAALWQVSAVVGAVASLLLLVFFWHPWLVLGVAINLAVFASLALQWPQALFVK